jgi:hypothetical protein
MTVHFVTLLALLHSKRTEHDLLRHDCPLIEGAMCWKCHELDRVIDHYRELSARASENLSRKGIDMLIEKLQTKKKALHQEDPDAA